jgi:hypothetical protein
MSKKHLAACVLAALSLSFQATSSAHDEGEVSIVSPQDGATIKGPVTVQFGIKGMELAPAGTDKPNTGHHHLLIDVDNLPAMDKPIPADDHFKHFGKAQTETTLTLPAGKHTLQLVLGDGKHVPHQHALVSKKITITVE